MIVFFVVLILALGAVEYFSLKIPPGRIEYDISPSRPAIEPDEPFQIISRFKNTGWLPVGFLRVRENLPDGIDADVASSTGGFKRKFLKSNMGLPANLLCSLFLMPHQKVTLGIKAVLPRRGRYFIGETTLFTGDFLGLRETEDQRRLNREFVVLPRRADDVDVKESLGGFLGDVSVRRYILEDPILTVGFREYTGREPLRSISWTQSARAGSLMVKKYDFTAEPSACVLLNTECPDWLHDKEKSAAIERCFSIARTVCEILETKRIRYSFITNSSAAGVSGIWSSIGDGLGEAHLMAILTGLGRATYTHTAPFTVTLEKAIHSAISGKAYILITPVMLPEYQMGANRLRDLSGGGILVISAHKEA